MSDMENIFTRIDGCRDEIIDLQRELTAACGPGT